MLIRSDTFRTRYFDPSDMPTATTVRNWVHLGIIKGKVINTGQRSQVWIDDEAFEKTTVFEAKPPVNPAVQALVDRILQARDRHARSR